MKQTKSAGIEALKIIAKAKRTGKTNTRAVQCALDRLSQLDDRPIIPNYAFTSRIHRRQEADEESGHKHFDVTGVGVTIGGEFVPIQQPESPDDHDAHLGWHEPAESAEENPFEQAAETLNKIILFLAAAQTPQSIGLRAASLVLILRPECLDDSMGATMSGIAKVFGVHRAAIQKYTNEIRKLTTDKRWVGKRQRTAGRDANRANAIKQHTHAGHNIKHIIKTTQTLQD